MMIRLLSASVIVYIIYRTINVMTFEQFYRLAINNYLILFVMVFVLWRLLETKLDIFKQIFRIGFLAFIFLGVINFLDISGKFYWITSNIGIETFFGTHFNTSTEWYFGMIQSFLGIFGGSIVLWLVKDLIPRSK